MRTEILAKSAPKVLSWRPAKTFAKPQKREKPKIDKPTIRLLEPPVLDPGG